MNKIHNRQSERRTALSLFSGAGGLDIGVTQAGFDILACAEIDPHCCATLRHAVASEGRATQVIEGDIRTVNPVCLREEFRLQPGELDLLCGGSPCQSFSQIGKRECLQDERGMLLFEFVRFAEALRPKAILMEQVKGLLNAPDAAGKIGGVYEKLRSDLENLGYQFSMKIINAADYGVPQLRQRVFIVATRSGISFDFPAPTHYNARKTGGLFEAPTYRTAGDVLGGLGEPAPKSDCPPENSHMDVTPAGDRRRIHGVQEGSHLARELHLPADQRGGLTKKDTTKFLRVNRKEPVNTLRCGEIFYHPTEDRYLTPREYMRIHGYPDNYLLKGPIRGRSGQVRVLDQHRQVANSVPPPVAFVIADAIQNALNAAPLALPEQAKFDNGEVVA